MMDKVRQLGIEIHLDSENSVSTFRQLAKILQSIEDYGMIRFDSRRNVLNSVVEFTKVENFSAVENYEIAWYNSRLIKV